MTNKEFFNRYNAHYHAFLNYTVKLCMDRTKAIDILEDASIRAYKTKTSMAQTDNFKSWMFVFIQNSYINLCHKKTMTKEDSKIAEQLFIPEHNKHSTSIEVSLLSWKQLLTRLIHVPNMYRKPFVYHYWGYTYDEISERLKLDLGEVKSRILTAKEIIQSTIDGAMVA